MSRFPRLAAVKPLPSDETTPPVTKMCLVAFVITDFQLSAHKESNPYPLAL